MEEEVHDEDEALKACNDGGRHTRGRIAVKLM